MDTMEYKGYRGAVRYSAEDRVLHGRILGIEDVAGRRDSGVVDGPGPGADAEDVQPPDAQVADAEDSPPCSSMFTAEHGDHRYFVSSTNVFFDQAVAECFAMGGHLAVIDNDDENDFVSGLLSADTWIGYDDHIVENRFE